MHGGNWAAFEEQYGQMPLDFSANISPLGVPESVRQAVILAAEETDRYPDPLCRELRREIGKAEQVSPDWVICGNGAADLIWRLAAVCRGGRALLPVPSFSEYRRAIEANGGTVVTFMLREEDDFRLTDRFTAILQETFGCCGTEEKKHTDPKETGCGSVWLCEPGNPSGVTSDPDLLIKVLDLCTEAGILLVVDECFLDLTDEPERHTLKEMLRDHPNLVILRAFTKAYAMAGIRLGYALCSNPGLLGKMQAAGQPWEVSHLAQKAGIAALSDTEYLKKVKNLICIERDHLRRGLEELGFRVIPGEANYLLFHDIRSRHGGTVLDDSGKEKTLGALLRDRRILIRDCSDFEGLTDGWYRAAVRTHEENRLLLKMIQY